MRPVTLIEYEQRILAVERHIDEHLDGDLSLECLAQVAGFSPFHFHRIFRGMTGESLLSLVRRKRLQRAAEMLNLSDRSIGEVALESGYDTPESFSRTFKAVLGINPSEYRTQTTSPFAPLVSGMVRREIAMNVELVNLPVRRVAYLRHFGPYDQVGETWGRLYALAGRMGFYPPRTQFFGCPQDDPEVTPAEQVRYDACFVVDPGFVPADGLAIRELEGGEYAKVIHKGAYDSIGVTYAELCGQWAPQHHRAIRAAPSIEAYVGDPRTTAPKDRITEIYLPLE
ncbi:MAG: AraC family transcriptional regulator [Fimbriimonas sp.]|nr:AraC family transcriptional regulator [Fimbriimonas sp.]